MTTIGSSTDIDAEILYNSGATATEETSQESEDRLRELRERLSLERSLPNMVTAGPACPNTDHKVTRIAARIQPMDATANVEAGTKITWGGSEGTTVNTYVNGSIKDDSGAYGRVNVEHEWGKGGEATVVGGSSKTIEADTKEKK